MDAQMREKPREQEKPSCDHRNKSDADEWADGIDYELHRLRPNT
jgi:hypothetical protein